ncbi:MAG: UPF0182 family protein [Acidobacteriota bacterium]|nr:UPF0182 family protein [Acidobacteriota bacterium]
MSSATILPGQSAVGDEATGLPSIALPRTPSAGLLWSRALTAASILVALFTIDQIMFLFFDYWLFESLGLTSVFWVNFRMGAQLYVVALVTFALAIAVPAFAHDVSSRVRGFVLKAAFLIASVAAFFAARNYTEFLLYSNGSDFGKNDPIFGKDYGFFTFDLPNIWIAWKYFMWAAVLMLVCSLACAALARRRPAQGPSVSRLGYRVGAAASLCTRIAWVLCGIVLATGVWLSRYGLLLRDNSQAASIKRGAQYLDVTGLFSTLNYIWVTTFIVLGVTAAGFFLLRALRRGADGSSTGWRASFRTAGKVALLLIAFDFAFRCAVVVRNWVFVKPNEPVIQLPYIARHVDATREAYGLEKVKEVNFLPNRPGDPLPTADELLASPTLKNAPLWPGYVSYVERWLDRQHSQRILQTQGSSMVYGPTLELLQQQQKLRTYYNFVNVDNVRYTIDGEERMFISAARETPLYEPVPWLAYWGQRFMMFTHGFGLVIAPVGEVNGRGEMDYVSYDIPAKVKYPQLALTEPRIYYGEGSATMAFSNVHKMKELDYPTDQDRAEIFLPASEKTGVHINSVWKRIVFGWRSGKFWELVFSDLIKPDTRAHYFRTPIDRLDRVAPFLFYDSNPYAVNVDGRIVWIVNGMTTTDRYPYSYPEELGDKSDERSPFPRPTRMANYIEDSVKATVDAATGQVTFYKISDSPVVRTWARIYPGLFTPAEKMPAGVRSQLTYPIQMMHIQFDDLYIYYHMKDPMYFFNMEDMWDDADEVLGPILDTGKAITFSMEPYQLMLDTGKGPLPAATPRVQYSMAMVFTPEKALNLRGIPIVYQDGADYGKITVLQVPKGQYVIGPEQADAAVDQEPTISQNFSWWNRKGMEVIRGHTSLLVIGNEALYVEPIFLRSQQNSVPQLKEVIVVMRGKPFMAESLEKAVRDAVAWHSSHSASEVPRPIERSPATKASLDGSPAARAALLNAEEH